MLMTCRHVRQLHDAYVDGELSPNLMAEVHAHLLQCPECQQRVEMIRAGGSVIAQDRSEPMLDSGFASRVVASLPKVKTNVGARMETRRGRRQRMWRVAISVSLPAAAAVLFFSVLIWPSSEPDAAPTDLRLKVVAGEVIESPTKALENTRLATQNLNQLIEISADEARQDVKKELEKVREPATFTDLLFEPFTGLLDEPETETDLDEEEIVRF